MPLGAVAARRVDGGSHAALDGVGGCGRAGDGVHGQRLAVQNAGNEQLLGVGKPFAGGAVAFFDHFDGSDRAVLERHVAGHLGEEAEAGSRAAVGSVGHRRLFALLAGGLGQAGRQGYLGGAAGDRRAAHAIDFGALGLQNLAGQGIPRGRADALRLARNIQRYFGDGGFIHRDGYRHVAMEACG